MSSKPCYKNKKNNDSSNPLGETFLSYNCVIGADVSSSQGFSELLIKILYLTRVITFFSHWTSHVVLQTAPLDLSCSMLSLLEVPEYRRQSCSLWSSVLWREPVHRRCRTNHPSIQVFRGKLHRGILIRGAVDQYCMCCRGSWLSYLI